MRLTLYTCNFYVLRGMIYLDYRGGYSCHALPRGRMRIKRHPIIKYNGKEIKSLLQLAAWEGDVSTIAFGL